MGMEVMVFEEYYAAAKSILEQTMVAWISR